MRIRTSKVVVIRRSYSVIQWAARLPYKSLDAPLLISGLELFSLHPPLFRILRYVIRVAHTHTQTFTLYSTTHAIHSIVQVASPFMRTFARLFSNILPKFGFTKIDSKLISHDEHVREIYLTDPLIYHGVFRARWGHEMMTTMDDIKDHMDSITFPFLVMQGTEDGLCLPEGATYLRNHAASKDKTLKEFPKMYHEIFNENGHEAVLEYMVAWLTARRRAALGNRREKVDDEDSKLPTS